MLAKKFIQKKLSTPKFIIVEEKIRPQCKVVTQPAAKYNIC